MTMTYHQTSTPAPAAVSSVSRKAARLTIAGSASALALLLILHVVRPDLDPAWHVLSEYALGPTGWMMTLAFLCYSAASAGLFVALLPQIRTTGGRIGLAFLAFTALGLALSTFPIDPTATAPGEGTFSGVMHGIASMIGVSGQVLAGIVLGHALARRALWKPARLPLLVAAHFIWIGVRPDVRIALDPHPAADDGRSLDDWLGQPPDDARLRHLDDHRRLAPRPQIAGKAKAAPEGSAAWHA